MHLVNIVTYLENILVIEWEISNLMIALVVYIEKDVVDNIDSETIISHNDFKIWKLVKGNFKNVRTKFGLDPK